MSLPVVNVSRGNAPDPARYAPIQAGEYLARRLNEVSGSPPEADYS